MTAPANPADPAAAGTRRDPRKRPRAGWSPWTIRPDSWGAPRTPEDATDIITPEDGPPVTTRKARP